MKDEENMLAFVIPSPGHTFGMVMWVPKPSSDVNGRKYGYALIWVLRVGVCKTDLEILWDTWAFMACLDMSLSVLLGDEVTQQKWIRKWPAMLALYSRESTQHLSLATATPTDVSFFGGRCKRRCQFKRERCREGCAAWAASDGMWVGRDLSCASQARGRFWFHWKVQ